MHDPQISALSVEQAGPAAGAPCPQVQVLAAQLAPSAVKPALQLPHAVVPDEQSFLFASEHAFLAAASQTSAMQRRGKAANKRQRGGANGRWLRKRSACNVAPESRGRGGSVGLACWRDGVTNDATDRRERWSDRETKVGLVGRWLSWWVLQPRILEMMERVKYQVMERGRSTDRELKR